MPDTVKPRAFSGEIKADAAHPGPDGVPATGAAIEVDYMRLPAAPADARSAGPAVPPGNIRSTAPPVRGMDMLRKPDAAATSGPRRGGVLFWSVGLLLVLAAFWISGGHAIVGRLALFHSATPEAPLRISTLTSRVDGSGEKPILMLDGEVVNGGAAAQHLSGLLIAVTAGDGTVTRYRLGTGGRPLSPGETFAFSSRFDAPMNGIEDVSVAVEE
jgi:hypothetical protein